MFLIGRDNNDRFWCSFVVDSRSESFEASWVQGYPEAPMQFLSA